jgi:hypothetical protein
MKKRTSKAKARRAYIVTEDLSLLVCRWCSQQKPKIPTESLQQSSFFKDTLDQLAHALRKHCFSEDDVEVITLQGTTFDDLLSKQDAATDLREFWVSLDDVYPKPLGESESKYNMSVTRYVDTGGNKLGHGPRPETSKKSLKEQVRECVNIWEDTKRQKDLDELPLILIDDGTFDGDTVKEVLDEFAKQEVFINSVRLGVAKRMGIEAIADWRFEEAPADGETRIHKIYFIGASKLCPPIHDFVPGVLYAGKVVAQKKGDEIEPLRVGEQKIPVRSQYLYGWGNVISWASIPEEKAKQFTADALKLSIQLWERLEHLRQEPILVKNLPAIPQILYSKDPVRMQSQLGRSWLEVLRKRQEEIERIL